MIHRKMLTKASLLSLLAVCALTTGGCGGSATNGDTLGTTPAAGPVVVGIDANNADASGAEFSGLLTPAVSGQPTASDKAYMTTATAITVLSGQPPITGSNSYIGTGDYPDGTLNTAPVPLGTTVAFRAYIVNGQNSNGDRAYIPINSVVLTSSDPEAVAAGFSAKPLALAFIANGSAKGPFASATFSTATFPLPFTTNGAHTFSVTIVDTAGQSSRTDFTVMVGVPPVVPASAVKHR